MTHTNAPPPLTPTFGVRHLSPMGAWHLRRFLDEIRPEVVLVEGLADATELIPDIVRPDTVPPIAILAYTQKPPVRTLFYPIARYSPEYQALTWAAEHKAKARFIDLPSDIFLALNRRAEEEARAARERAEAEGEEGNEGEESTASASPVESEPSIDERGSLYDHFARQFDEPDYETYWERHFEHNLSADSYRLAAFEFGAGLREFDRDTNRGRAENLVREAHMRRAIAEEIAAGADPAKIVAVVGAFHAPVLAAGGDALSDDELAALPRLESKLTLMPYSYFKLSSQSGYGAGNHAPAYFELAWEALEGGDFGELPSKYLSLLARHLRESGSSRSTAAVIEGVRLANTLSALKDGLAPTLRDLQDAAVALLGHGERSSVQEAFARVEIGTAIGSLPKGVSQTSIQEDFDRELERLKLSKYKTAVLQDLRLDLRENRRVKTRAAAFLDLHRSGFLHRLDVLEIGFAKKARAGASAGTTWAEAWQIQWSPESEMHLVEAVLLGETVELATAFKFKTMLDDCKSIAAAADLVRRSCECALMESMDLARARVQNLAAESSDFPALAHAAHALSATARYGDVRQFDPAPLHPLIEELFVQGSLALRSGANCDNAAARKNLSGMNELDQVSLDFHDRVDEELWIRELRALAAADHLNPLLSGFACAILLERNLISNEELAREVSRRLSPGIEADLGAGWFEGLAKRNRYALLSRLALWEQLAAYVASLEDDQFTRALVFLRRAFGEFSPREKQAIAENLGEIWGVGAAAASELMHSELSEEEEKKIEELNDFDFDDL